MSCCYHLGPCVIYIDLRLLRNSNVLLIKHLLGGTWETCLRR